MLSKSMKQCFFSCLILALCQAAYAKENANNCIGVIEKDVQTGLIKDYFLTVQKSGTYLCNQQSENCSPMLIKDVVENAEDDNLAFIINNNIEFLNSNGFYFDEYNIALGYAHSLFIAVFIAKDALNHNLMFDNNVLTINPKAQQYEIGAYPRGLLRPINHMFIKEKITQVIITKQQGKINKAIFTTDKNERFQYRLTYQKNKLIRSEILFKKSPHLPWQMDGATNYDYKAC